VTARIPNSTPPTETTASDGSGPKRSAMSGPPETQPDGAQVSELSRTVAAAMGSNDQKVEALRREVAAGAYVVDATKVIEKILQSENFE